MISEKEVDMAAKKFGVNRMDFILSVWFKEHHGALSEAIYLGHISLGDACKELMFKRIWDNQLGWISPDSRARK